MFVKLHIIQNYGPSNLNRGQDGRPKSCLLGDYQRARVSSQALKRNIRDSPLFAEKANKLGKTFQTRLLPHLIEERLKKEGVDEEKSVLLVNKLKKIGTSGRGGGGEGNQKAETSQNLFFSESELELLTEKALEWANKSEKKIKELKIEEEIRKITDKTGARISPNIALFGRFITSDIFPTIPSSIQVAHAVSTNQRTLQTDYFVAVDELKDKEASMIGETEFVSPCFYKYFSIDFDQILTNMKLNYTKEFEADQVRIEMVDLIEAFIRAAVLDVSGGMQNSFAAHTLPSFILIEVPTKRYSYNYSNAFLTPIRPIRDSDIVGESIKALVAHMNSLTEAYGLDMDTKRFGLFVAPYEDSAFNGMVCSSIDELIAKTKEALLGKK